MTTQVEPGNLNVLRRELAGQVSEWRFWIVLLLASQYVLFQLIWPVEYQDAPRNLHWGIYVTEQPRFLLDAEDTYDRSYGFPPDDPSLAPAGLARDQGIWFHAWWGPLYPLIIAFLWKLSASYTLLQLISPLFAGAVVLMTYLFGARYFNRRIGFTAALILSIIPVFREHAVLAFTEPVAALLLFAALWSHLERRRVWTALFGSLAVLMKIDMIFLYFGVVLITVWLYLSQHRDKYDFQHALNRHALIRHALTSLAIPGVVAAAWLVLNYGINQRPITVMGLPGIENLIMLAPLVMEQFFTTIPLLTYLTLGLMVLCIGLAIWRQSFAKTEVYQLLGTWSGLGVIVLLVYMVFPGAANNPRVLIPAFPALCLLVAAGLNQMSMRPRMLAESYLVVILVMMSAVGGLYQVILSEQHQATLPVWEKLSGEPSGYVMTEYFWHANLYARQPATWFLGDAVYEANILHNLENFRLYLEEHPIRYIVLPLHDNPGRQLDSKTVRIYQVLGVGRKLELRSQPVVSSEVRAYLEQNFPKVVVGEFVIFTIR